MTDLERTLEEERRIINAYPYLYLTVEVMPETGERGVAAFEEHDEDAGLLGYSHMVADGMHGPQAERLAHSWNALPLRNAQVEAASGLVGELNQAAEESRSSSYGQIDATWARMQGAAFAYEDAARRIRRAIDEAGG